MQGELQQLCEDFRAQLTDLPPSAIQAHPPGEPQKWCLRQIIEHLNLSYQFTSSALQQRLAKGTVTRVRPTLKEVARRTLVLKAGYFPSGITAPEAVVPAATAAPISGFDLWQGFRHELETMCALLDECQARFGNQRLQRHFAFGPLTANEWRRFHAIHGKHHLKQVEVCGKAFRK